MIFFTAALVLVRNGKKLTIMYTWVSRAKNGILPLSLVTTETKGAKNLSERIKDLERENKMLRSENAQIMRENQIPEDAAAFFAARRKK